MVSVFHCFSSPPPPPHHPPLPYSLLAFIVILTSVFDFLKFAGFHFCHSLFRSALKNNNFLTFLFTFGVFQSFKFLLSESVVLVHSFFPQSNVHVRTCTRNVKPSHTNNETETKTSPPPLTRLSLLRPPPPTTTIWLKCCFTSTETVGLLGTWSPGCPPQLSHSS